MLFKIKELFVLITLFLLIISCGGESGNENEGYIRVIFNSRNGTPVGTQIIHDGDALLRPSDPACAGSTFDGWYKEAACINSWNFESGRPVSDTILYSGWRLSGTAETFSESHRPNLELISDPVNGDYYFCKPWNYEEGYNSGKKYPLLIYLHGMDQAGYLRNLYYMGYDNPDGYGKSVSSSFKKTYPCFVFVPETGTSWDTAKLIAQIEFIKAAYRIDANRIYIHGFSMGAWGCYSLANAYYAYNGQLFAAIIRQSGMGTLIHSAVAEKTSIWLMAGLRISGPGSESQNTIDDTRAAYSYLKNLPQNSGAFEINRSHTSGSHSADTLELIKDGREFAKITEFPDDGHFTAEYPFLDPSVMAWLFDQSLENR